MSAGATLDFSQPVPVSGSTAGASTPSPSSNLDFSKAIALQGGGTPDPTAGMGEEEKFLYRNPEYRQFLENNPSYKYLAKDSRFPNREPGIYPMGPGNEWRNDPNSPMATNSEFPVDLHLLKHSLEGAGEGAMAAGAALGVEPALELGSAGIEAARNLVTAPLGGTAPIVRAIPHIIRFAKVLGQLGVGTGAAIALLKELTGGENK